MGFCLHNDILLFCVHFMEFPVHFWKKCGYPLPFLGFSCSFWDFMPEKASLFSVFLCLVRLWCYLCF